MSTCWAATPSPCRDPNEAEPRPACLSLSHGRVTCGPARQFGERGNRAQARGGVFRGRTDPAERREGQHDNADKVTVLAQVVVVADGILAQGALPLSQLRSTLSIFANPANRHRAVSLTAKEFRYSFGNALTEEESNALYERWAIPSPARPLFEAASAALSPHSPAQVDTANQDRGPLLLTMGGKDHTVPEAITKSTLKQYRHSDAVTDLVEFTDRGHSLTIDAGWREVAEACLAWLNKQGL